MVDPPAGGLLSRMFTTYVIKKSRNKIYIGNTKDLQSRLQYHNGTLPNKKTSFTYKQGGPWTLVYTEKYDTLALAQKRERELKTARGRKFIKNILQI